MIAIQLQVRYGCKVKGLCVTEVVCVSEYDDYVYMNKVLFQNFILHTVRDAKLSAILIATCRRDS